MTQAGTYPSSSVCPDALGRDPAGSGISENPWPFCWKTRAEHEIMYGSGFRFDAERTVAWSVLALAKEVDAA